MTKLQDGGQTYWVDEHGIIHVEAERDLALGGTEAQASIRMVAQVGGGVRRPVIIDLRRIRSMNRDARQYFAGPETCEIVPAAALLVGSPLTRAIGNFFMGFNKPLSPTRMFTSEPEAIAWLKSLI